MFRWLKKEPSRFNKICFHKEHYSNYSYLVESLLTWDSWQEIRYSGKCVQLDSLCYECIIKNKVFWIAEENLRFPNESSCH